MAAEAGRAVLSRRTCQTDGIPSSESSSCIRTPRTRPGSVCCDWNGGVAEAGGTHLVLEGRLQLQRQPELWDRQVPAQSVNKGPTGVRQGVNKALARGARGRASCLKLLSRFSRGLQLGRQLQMWTGPAAAPAGRAPAGWADQWVGKS